MKNLIILIAAAGLIVACSNKSNNDSGAGTINPRATAFEKSAVGGWLSECLFDQENRVPYVDAIQIQAGGKGISRKLVYQTQDCSGAMVRDHGAQPFTYTVKSANGNVSELTLNVNGQSVDVRITIEGNEMVLSTGQQIIRYRKDPANPNPGNGGGGDNAGFAAAFDRVAVGTWASMDCFQGEGYTYSIILSVKGSGQASTILNIYRNGNCAGDPEPTREQAGTYQVKSFANGNGEIVLDGQHTVKVALQGNNMTIQTQNGNQRYVRVR